MCLPTRSLFAVLLLLTACNPDESPETHTASAVTPAAEATDSVDPYLLAAGDGWTALHDIALPEPGTAVLTIEGQEYTLDITCSGEGEVNDPSDQTLFRFNLEGSGQAPDGRDVILIGFRSVAAEIDEYYGVQDAASLQFGIRVDGTLTHSSIVASPGDQDPTGAGLPLLHISPTGGITLQADMNRMPTHREAPSGVAVFAGQCQEGWPAVN